MKREILFECNKFKVEKDSKGEYWTIHAGTSLLEARMIYYSEVISKIAADVPKKYIKLVITEDWRSMFKHNNLKKDIQNDNTTKVIVLSQLETGELVPISGKKDEHGE